MEELRFWYPASITQITEINDSFDSALLRVCYPGRNRNKSDIPKHVIEKATPTMAYCPVVANYNVATDEIGGHDVDIIRDGSGNLKMVNLTDAVGVVPGNPEWSWCTVTEDDGKERDYLCVPVILWKRASVYEKIKRDGITGQSMEIRVCEGRVSDGYFVVDSFEFTAFCLLGDGIEPCFESASLEMFSANSVSDRFSAMMAEYKQKFTSVMTVSTDDINTPIGEKNFTKGGEGSLNIDELMAKYGLTNEDVNIDIEGKTTEEIEALFSNIRDAKFADSDDAGSDNGDNEPDDTQSNPDGNDDKGNEDDSNDDNDNEPQEDDNDDAPGGTKSTFQLTAGQMVHEICEALGKVTYTDEWGTWSRYGYMDYDPQTNEVYVYDYTDWNLYGFTFSLNGDYVVIDFDSKKRKKFAYVDFDEGDVEANYKYMLNTANAKFEVLANEIVELRKFKRTVEDAERKAKEDEVFSKFEDLAEDAKFIELRNNCSGLSIEEIEDKCFAIRGRNVNVQMKFSQDNSGPVRIPVERKKLSADEPYGGLFLEYGIVK